MIPIYGHRWNKDEDGRGWLGGSFVHSSFPRFGCVHKSVKALIENNNWWWILSKTWRWFKERCRWRSIERDACEWFEYCRHPESEECNEGRCEVSRIGHEGCPREG